MALDMVLPRGPAKGLLLMTGVPLYRQAQRDAECLVSDEETSRLRRPRDPSVKQEEVRSANRLYIRVV